MLYIMEDANSYLSLFFDLTIRDLIHSALRLRPDRLVIGEFRGGEALDLLQALNTGHAGSMSTLHANSPRGSLDGVFTGTGQKPTFLHDAKLRKLPLDEATFELAPGVQIE